MKTTAILQELGKQINAKDEKQDVIQALVILLIDSLKIKGAPSEKK